MLRVFIGYDRRMPVLYNVAQHTLNELSTKPLSITPLNLDHLREVYVRSHDENQSTEFSFSRFLVPYLSGYEGWSLFMDNDIVCNADISELFKLVNDKYAVMCTKHNHVPKNATKFLGAKQTTYDKKNWSSVMLFNNAKCKALTPAYVNVATGLELHQFKWLKSDDLIGDIPLTWNYLLNVQEGFDCHAKMFHYTEGGPYFAKHVKNSEPWLHAFQDANRSADLDVYDLVRRSNELT
jgi:lipopolysaccharide biosynthesis glycosyltransferase